MVSRLRCLVASCFLLSVMATARAESNGPEQWGERYAQALISGTPEVQAETVKDIFAPAVVQKIGVERLTAQMAKIKKDFSPDEFHHAEMTKTDIGPGVARRVLHVYVRRKGEKVWRDIQMVLDAAPPHRIANIAFIAEVTEPVPLPNGDIDDPTTLDWLDRYVTKLNRENDLSGAILIAHATDILFERYFGFADAERKTPVGPGTLFNLGSGNKMFTALAITQLSVENQLRLDDPLTKFFPDYPSPEKARLVTVRHLLTHTSGIGEYWRPDTDAERLAATDWHQLLPLVRGVGFDFDPGTKAAYSNSNYVLLGAIIEQVTKKDYFDVIAERIYKPAGMKTAGSYAYDRQAQPLAMPLTRDPSGNGWKEAPHATRGSPTGGGYATAADLLSFTQALRQSQLVSRATLMQMIANANGALPGELRYGLGFIPEKHGKFDSFGHGGIAPGVNFEYRYFAAIDVTLVIFSNQDNGAYDDLRKTATRLISGER